MDENSIDKYYSLIDKNLLNNLCKNNNLKNLISLSTVTDLYVFNKKNKKWHLKSKDKLLKECENIKKKELKSSSHLLANLAKLNDNNYNGNIKNICDNLQNKISNIDNIIKCIQHLDSTVDIHPLNQNNNKVNIVNFNDYKEDTTNIKIIDIKNPKINNTNKDIERSSESPFDFIECYSNCN